MTLSTLTQTPRTCERPHQSAPAALLPNRLFRRPPSSSPADNSPSDNVVRRFLTALMRCLAVAAV